MTEPGPVTVAGRYLLGDRIGVGGMAQVFRGRDLLLDRHVAVKLFGPSVDAHGPDRIRDEMRTLAMLSHPGLVTVFDAGTDEPAGGGPPRAFLVMTLIDGPTLGQRVGAGPLPAAEVAALGEAIADALAYVHSRGVVHRDVKPANVLLDQDGRPYLADFGIARTLGQVGHTATGLTVGTASFLSPEQVLGQSVGPPADVYALGLVLLECLTGRREYPGQTAEAAVVRLSRRPVIDAGLPDPWPALLTRMTEPSPTVRPSAGMVAAVLRGQQRLPPLPASADPATTPMSIPLRPADGAGPAPARTRLLPRPVPRPTSRARPAATRFGWVWSRGRAQVLAAGVGAALLITLVALFSGSSAPAPGPAAPAPTGSPGAGTLRTDLTRLQQLVTP